LAGRARKQLEAEGKEPAPEVVRALVEPQVAALKAHGLLMQEWTAAAAGCDPGMIGGGNSPTRVKKIEYVVLAGGEVKHVPPTEEGIRGLVHELVESHILE
jgi:hypothetical protein